MSKVVYLPLEHEEMRYTKHLDVAIRKELLERSPQYMVSYPAVGHYRCLPVGCFLNAPSTIRFKSAQMKELADYWLDGYVKTDDVIFCADMWMPGIEAVRYMQHFTGVKPKLHGLLHAGSFTDTDSVRGIERWAALFENCLFDQFDRIIVGSNFIKNDVVSKRLVDPAKIVVSPFPLDPELENNPIKDNIVVFNGRLHPEKQPELFKFMQENCNVPTDTRWINTYEKQFSKAAYRTLLSRAKCVVSFALQENFGFGVAEATMSGCIPVVPARLVYPEFYPPSCCYHSLKECQAMIEQAMWTYNPLAQAAIATHLRSALTPDLSTWF